MRMVNVEKSNDIKLSELSPEEFALAVNSIQARINVTQAMRRGELGINVTVQEDDIAVTVDVDADIDAKVNVEVNANVDTNVVVQADINEPVSVERIEETDKQFARRVRFNLKVEEFRARQAKLEEERQQSKVNRLLSKLINR